MILWSGSRQERCAEDSISTTARHLPTQTFASSCTLAHTRPSSRGNPIPRAVFIRSPSSAGGNSQCAAVAGPPRHLSLETIRSRRNRKAFVWALLAVGLALLVTAILVGSTLSRAKAPKSALEQFWSPALATAQPVLICLAKPAVYLPSVKLYQRHSKTPDLFTSQFERLMQKPDLAPNEKIVWGDMVEYPDYGLAAGDVYAATGISALFGQIGKKNQVRIGGNYSFEDLRNSPAVVIGAFNNRWTMQMTSNLHFAFAEEGDQSIIREEGPSGRAWRSERDAAGKTIGDYAVVTRLLNSRTGQFVVVVAGIKSYGTQAAGEFVSNPQYLEKTLRSAPRTGRGEMCRSLFRPPSLTCCRARRKPLPSTFGEMAPGHAFRQPASSLSWSPRSNPSYRNRQHVHRR